MIGNFGLHRKATMAARAVPIARELARRGNHVSVLMPTEPVLAKPTEDIGTIRLSSVGRFPPLPFVGHVWVGVQLVWAALRLRPDVLYAFKPIAYAGLALFVFWLLRSLGFVDSVLALDADDWEGEGGWIDREPRSWWLRRLITWQERWCLAHADVVSVASREIERLANLDRRRVIYAPNAASPSSPGWIPGDGSSIRASLGLRDTPLILAYTRFVEFDPARLLAVLERTRSLVPGTHLLVVGKGLRDEDQVLLRCAAQRGLDHAVHLIGWVPAYELPDYLAAGDVAAYLLDDTRLNRAKCPMKLVDLLLAGACVVADDVGQAHEYVTDGETGYLVRPGDVDAMAKRLASLLVDRETRQKLGQAARASVLAHWTWARQVAPLADALEKAALC